MEGENSITTNIRIGERIGQLRKKAGLKQEELGKAVGVSTQAVSRWECGGAPDIELLPSIADTLHVSVDELFGRTPTAQTDIKELLARTLAAYSKEDRMKEACSLVWEIQKALLVLEEPTTDKISMYNILDAATTKNQGKGQTLDQSQSQVQNSDQSPKETGEASDPEDIAIRGAILEMDRGYMSYGFDIFDYSFICVQPENGFESVIKDADSLRRLFSLLSKPHCLEIFVALYRKKPNENVTGRLLAKELSLPEAEVIAVLDELHSYRLIKSMEISDTNGTIHIYSYEGSEEWVAFLLFASQLMTTDNEVKLAVNMRKKPAFSQKLGYKNSHASWEKKTGKQNWLKLYENEKA